TPDVPVTAEAVHEKRWSVRPTFCVAARPLRPGSKVARPDCVVGGGPVQTCAGVDALAGTLSVAITTALATSPNVCLTNMLTPTSAPPKPHASPIRRLVRLSRYATSVSPNEHSDPPRYRERPRSVDVGDVGGVALAPRSRYLGLL